jgi:hypothetical protein
MITALCRRHTERFSKQGSKNFYFPGYTKNTEWNGQCRFYIWIARDQIKASENILVLYVNWFICINMFELFHGCKMNHKNENK